MPLATEKKSLGNKPLRLFLLAWMLAGLLLSFLIRGEPLIQRHRAFFGENLAKLSLNLTNLVSEEAARRPVE